MKKYALKALFALVLIPVAAFGQGSGGPLTTQGLHQQEIHSAATRAFGGVTIARTGRAGLMFDNPAAMAGLDGIQVSVGAARQYVDLSQEQNFAPVRYYPNLSLLLEGTTGSIPDPDPDLIGFTPADSVQRPFDDITPNWSRSNTSDLPLHAMLAAPFSMGGVSFGAGIGAVRYANLDHYYQNNNVLTPEVLSVRPLPTLRPTDNNPITADWYQSIRSRDGEIRAYGAALSGTIESANLTIGVSGLMLDGTADDFEQDLQRGRLTFLANEFRADSVAGRVTRTGTSEFSGSEFTISGTLGGQYASLGFVVTPPTTITRSYEMEVVADTSGSTATSRLSGEDEMQLPWRGSVGLLLQPRDRLRIGLQYEVRPYDSATFTDASGTETSPWVSSSLFRLGAEYELTQWLTLRGGVRGDADVFVPDGSALEDNPVSYRIYSGGLGFRFAGFQWDLTYEYADESYQDVWSSALSRNSNSRHTIVTDISYTLPFGR